MEWYTIEFLYPISFNEFIGSMFPNIGIISISTLQNYDVKKLYKFFDKKGIYLNIEMYEPSQWVFQLTLHNGTVIAPGKDPKQNRDEIEYEGFMWCFKILDKQLRKCEV